MGADRRVCEVLGFSGGAGGEFGGEVLGFVVELTGGDRQLGVAGGVADLRAVEAVAAGIGLIGEGRQVGADGGEGASAARKRASCGWLR